MSDAPVRFDPLGPLPRGTTLLEASAGTGKTYSITSLIVRLVIEEGVPIEKILAVTFTNLATAELTRRIRERLGEAFAALTAAVHGVRTSEDEVLRHLVQSAADNDALVERAENARIAVENFDRAPISTIHGFCQRILQQHALEAGVAFDVELLEDSAALIDEIVEDFWVQRVHDASDLDLDALDALGVSLRELRELARTAISHWSAPVVPPRPSPRVGDDAVRPPDATLTGRLQDAMDRAGPLYSAHAEAAIDAVVRARQDFTRPWFPSDYKLEDARRAADKVTALKLSPRVIEQLHILDRSWIDANFSQTPAFAHPEVFDATRDLVSAYRVWLPAARPWALTLRHDLIDFARYESARRAGQRRVWTFDDLLRKLADALDNPHAQRRLQAAVGGHYRAVFIDEFQDTDPIQWKIFRALFRTREHWLFLIGDPKQAIYRFRRADIRTYLAAKKDADHRFSLEKNHRSDVQVVDAVNAIFSGSSPESANMAFAVDGFGFPASTAAEQRRRLIGDDAAPLRALVIPRTPENTGKPPAELARARIHNDFAKREVPTRVALDIRKALGSGQRIRKFERDGSFSDRELGPRDIAVLVRTNEQAIAIRDALRAHGIPGILHGPQSVYQTEEALELMRVLKAVLEPARTRTVRAALVTHVMGYTAEELARLDRDDPRALEEPAKLLRDWQGVWLRSSFIQMFRQVSSAATARLLALEGGERKLANLLHLGELLHQAVADRDLKPAGLLQFLDRQRRHPDDRDERQQLRLQSDDPAVEILTVHKAKGLEFALVWVPYVWEGPRPRFEEKRDLVFRDPNAGYRVTLDIGLDDQDRQRKINLRLLDYEVQTEQLRLLYVALTRAKLQCTVCWGAFGWVHGSPLAYVLYANRRAHNPDALEAAVKDIKRRFDNVSDHDLMRPFAALAAQDPPLAAVVAKPPAFLGAWSPRGHEQTIAAREWQRQSPLDVAWRRTSFSGLVAELVDDEQALQKASDEDAPAGDEAIAEQVSGTSRVRLAGLTSGRMVGNALHKILEHVDFATATPTSVLPLVRDELAHHGVPLVAPSGEDLAGAVADAVVDVLDTPLSPMGFTLRDVPASARLPELAFVFPVAGGYHAAAPSLDRSPDRAGGFVVEQLRAAFEAHAGPGHGPWLATIGRLRFEAVRGFLSGSIDLVFRGPDRRFYVVDWKSNRLGTLGVPEEYTRERLWRGMDAHHYHLQYHLYTLALDRFLRARSRDYDYERDFGGVFYCFLRGMSPAYPAGNGVFFDRPPAALVAALDRAFGPTRADRGDPSMASP